jgi:hypothetical protein
VDGTQVIVIIGTFSAMFLCLSSKIDGVRKDLTQEIQKVNETLGAEIQKVDRRIQRIEDRLEFSNKIVYVQHDEVKEE